MANARQFMAARTAAWAKSGSQIKLCDFIMADDNAYIDTGFVPVEEQYFEVECSASVANFHSAVFFGSYESSSGDLFNGTNCAFYIPFNDRLISYRVRLDGGDWNYWNSTAYDGQDFFDGNFHEFVFSYNDLRRTSSVVVDGITTINTASSRFGGNTSTTTDVPISVFCGMTPDGTKKGHVTQSNDFKIKRLTFKNKEGIVIADFRAAKKSDGEYGLINLTDGIFHGGVGGLISGLP